MGRGREGKTRKGERERRGIKEVERVKGRGWIKGGEKVEGVK